MTYWKCLEGHITGVISVQWGIVGCVECDQHLCNHFSSTSASKSFELWKRGQDYDIAAWLIRTDWTDILVATQESRRRLGNEYVQNRLQEQYYPGLVNIAVRYFYEASQLRAKCPFACGALSNPNTHRLLELYRNSIPILGPALFIYDMTMEASHQPLKAFITR